MVGRTKADGAEQGVASVWAETRGFGRGLTASAGGRASQAATEKAAKLEEQNQELLIMAEVQQQAYERMQMVLDNERAANTRAANTLTVGDDKALESAKVDLELGRMEIEKVGRPDA